MPYASTTDVGSVLNTDFTSTSDPSIIQVDDMISRADSWINEETGHRWDSNVVIDEQYDADGNTGRILLKHRPVLYILKVEYWDGGAWREGFDGMIGDIANTTSKLTYSSYLPEGKIVWWALRLEARLWYRVNYIWGYNTTPHYIRDLSAHLAALRVLDHWAGKVMSAEQVSSYRERLNGEVTRLTTQAIAHDSIGIMNR